MHPADDDPRPSGWRTAFRLPRSRRSAERELEDELAFHLSMREEKLRRAGHSPDEARRLAHERFGDIEQIAASCRRVDDPVLMKERWRSVFADLRQDLRFGTRSLSRAPAFATATIATLALAIGSATAIFTVAYSVLLKPLPFTEPNRLVSIDARWSEPGPGLLSAPEYVDVAESIRSLSGVAAFHEFEPTLTGAGAPQRLRVAVTTPNLFEVLGVRPVVGRLLTDDDARPESERTIVLGHALWRQQFGADPRVVGSTVRLDGRERTVVGVLPPEFAIADFQAFIPLFLDPQRLRLRGAHYLHALGRLNQSTGLDQLRAELSSYGSRAVADYPESYADPSFTLTAVPLHDAWRGATRPTLLILATAVALLLLLACANVANLLLVRSEARQREVAVRIALGAGKGRLARQMLTETFVLAVIGAALGLPLAVAGVRALLELHPGVLPVGTSVALDSTVLWLAIAVVGAAVLLSGITPAFQVRSLEVRSAISTGATGGGRRGGRLRSTLVLAEIALATVVLVGAGLVARSFWQLQQVNPGFRAEQVLTFDVSLPSQRYPDEVLVPQAYDRLLAMLRAVPGVRDAAAVSHLPMSGRLGSWLVEVEGRERSANEAELSPNFTIASRDYFKVIGIPVSVGRPFGPSDERGSQPVVVVSESMARAFWSGENPLGRRIRLGGPPGMTNPWMEVVGVVGDVRGEGLASEPRPTYYILDQHFPSLIGGSERRMSMVVRTSAPTSAVAPALRTAVAEFDPEVAAANIRPLARVVSGTVSRPRFTATVLVAFGAAALLLAIVGVYGVVAATVTRRRREMGVRLALGSSRSDVLRLVMVSGLWLALAGVGIGLVLSIALAQPMSSILHEVSTLDPTIFIAVPLVLVLAAVAATAIPAIRATRVDPVEALQPD